MVQDFMANHVPASSAAGTDFSSLKFFFNEEKNINIRYEKKICQYFDDLDIQQKAATKAGDAPEAERLFTLINGKAEERNKIWLDYKAATS